MRHLHTFVCAALIAIMPIAAVGQETAQAVTAIFIADADLASEQWAARNPTGMAISIRLGDETPVPPVRIESALRDDFKRYGITNVRFFFERGGSGGSSVVFNTRNHAWGPFGLADSRKHVQGAAEQHLFEVRRGLN
ncbi:hypothetical protein AAJ72_11125 [Citromicrobium sp. RCC1885]|nr:hypothetical protein AAJ72_11125 [Citromicrobium sp. RCC1885]KPM25929.1 hypothetical protein AAJ74_11865 [Citromicrobium sp. RCC1878]MAO03167.1 hypothetical protein [Citromicrobium sp.]OAM07997.1 hypothetical protein A0U43_12305 [Citromicrobium sp. RCC1897]|tara:strand:+ start:12154 stop:12564 length:411 start_codon:yes stop_codon:yes gene_type:complete